MTTTPAGAFAAIQARAISQITGLPMYWQNEKTTLPDDPTPFVYFEWITDRAEMAGFGGGRSANLYRNAGELVGYVFIPNDWGLAEGLTRAETVASAFRSYRSDAISCFGASVEPLGRGADMIPPGLSSAVGNYSVVMVLCEMHYDQIG